MAAPLNNDGRELLTFYATQIDAHAADVDTPAVVGRYRFEARIRGVQQADTATTSTRAHVQQFAVASTTAKEITHADVEVVRRFGAAFLTVVFELPLSDVTVVDGERAALDCRRGRVVRRHVVHGARSARRLRLLSDEVSDVTRSSVTLSWPARRPVGPPLTLAAVAQSLCTMPAVTFFVSFRHRTLSESKPVTFTSLMSRLHAYNVNNIWTVRHFS